MEEQRDSSLAKNLKKKKNCRGKQETFVHFAISSQKCAINQEAAPLLASLMYILRFHRKSGRCTFHYRAKARRAAFEPARWVATKLLSLL